MSGPISTSLPRVDTVTELDSSAAKWATLQKITWTDQTGQSRVWEAAARKTRSQKAGVDAVAIAPILLHPKREPSTMIIKQFRPPVNATCIEFPAGLIDEMDESVEVAALRELEEETGYKGSRVVDVSPIVGNDPGLTTANMQFAIVEVDLGEEDEVPEQHLDEGEHIERVVVPLKELYQKLVSYDEEGMTIDARLWHWAAGVQFARTTGRKYGL